MSTKLGWFDILLLCVVGGGSIVFFWWVGVLVDVVNSFIDEFGLLKT